MEKKISSESGHGNAMNFLTRKDWVILVAVLLLCLGFATWLFCGVIQTTVVVGGITLDKNSDGEYYVSVAVDSETVGKIQAEETRAKILPDGYLKDTEHELSGTVCYVSPTPADFNKLSQVLASEQAADFILGDSTRSYVVIIRLDLKDGKPVFENGEAVDDLQAMVYCDVTIILSSVRPYECLFSS